MEQQVASCGTLSLYYYTNSNSTSEIDFVMQCDSEALPIEVKAEEDLHSRSLKAMLSRDENLRGLRISMSRLAGGSPLRQSAPLRGIQLFQEAG